MPHAKEKTNAQLGRIFGLAKLLNSGKEDLEEMAGKRLSTLSFDEANVMIERLGGEPLPASAALSSRSQQLRRQKAGVKQIVSQAQLKKMERLWFFADSLRTVTGLKALCARVNRGVAWPRTTEQCNRVIEAIKSMNQRSAQARKEAA